MRRREARGATRRRGHRTVAPRLALAALALTILLVAGARATSPPPAVRAQGSGLSLEALPTSGAAPLLVEFNATVPAGTLPQLSWSFGDGAYLNGTAPSVDAPAHEYLRPGHFAAVLTATWSTGSVNASVGIDVFSIALAVRATAWPSNGTAPLTVDLNGSVEGGSGTYLNYSWTFGDGEQGSGLDVRFTYDLPGVYRANFTVEDENGTTATARVTVSVGSGNGPAHTLPNSSAGSPAPAPAGLLGPGAYLAALAVGVVGGVGVAAFFLWRARSRREWGGGGPESAPASEPSGAAWDPETTVADAPGPEDGTPTAPFDDQAAETPAERRVAAASRERARSPSELVGSRLALRIVAHLRAAPRTEAGGLGDPTVTQVGISESVGAEQSSVSRALARLVAAGLVESEIAHVEGAARRIRVYRLTPRGERLGAALGDTTPAPPAR